MIYISFFSFFFFLMLNNVDIGPCMHRNLSEFTGRVPEGIMIGCRTVEEKEVFKYYSLGSQDI